MPCLCCVVSGREPHHTTTHDSYTFHSWLRLAGACIFARRYWLRLTNCARDRARVLFNDPKGENRGSRCSRVRSASIGAFILRARQTNSWAAHEAALLAHFIEG